MLAFDHVGVPLLVQILPHIGAALCLLYLSEDSRILDLVVLGK